MKELNIVREKILSNMENYMDFAKHKDLVAFTVGADYFTYDDEIDEELVADFEEVIVAVEKDWLFKHMENGGVENPLDYLQNEYVWDDSYEWFINAQTLGKIAVIEFN